MPLPVITVGTLLIWFQKMLIVLLRVSLTMKHLLGNAITLKNDSWPLAFVEQSPTCESQLLRRFTMPFPKPDLIPLRGLF